MHQYGIGRSKDLHLSKRFYDKAITTNDDAYLAATLALIPLHIQMILNGDSSLRQQIREYLSSHIYQPFLPYTLPIWDYFFSDVTTKTENTQTQENQENQKIQENVTPQEESEQKSFITFGEEIFSSVEWEDLLLLILCGLLALLIVYRQFVY